MHQVFTNTPKHLYLRENFTVDPSTSARNENPLCFALPCCKSQGIDFNVACVLLCPYLCFQAWPVASWWYVCVCHLCMLVKFLYSHIFLTVSLLFGLSSNLYSCVLVAVCHYSSWCCVKKFFHSLNQWALVILVRTQILLNFSDRSMPAPCHRGVAMCVCVRACVRASLFKFVLLAEPTNMLDLRTTLWLEHYLQVGDTERSHVVFPVLMFPLPDWILCESFKFSLVYGPYCFCAAMRQVHVLKAATNWKATVFLGECCRLWPS